MMQILIFILSYFNGCYAPKEGDSLKSSVANSILNVPLDSSILRQRPLPEALSKALRSLAADKVDAASPRTSKSSSLLEVASASNSRGSVTDVFRDSLSSGTERTASESVRTIDIEGLQPENDPLRRIITRIFDWAAERSSSEEASAPASFIRSNEELRPKDDLLRSRIDRILDQIVAENFSNTATTSPSGFRVSSIESVYPEIIGRAIEKELRNSASTESRGVSSPSIPQEVITRIMQEESSRATPDSTRSSSAREEPSLGGIPARNIVAGIFARLPNEKSSRVISDSTRSSSTQEQTNRPSLLEVASVSRLSNTSTTSPVSFRESSTDIVDPVIVGRAQEESSRATPDSTRSSSALEQINLQYASPASIVANLFRGLQEDESSRRTPASTISSSAQEQINLSDTTYAVDAGVFYEPIRSSISSGSNPSVQAIESAGLSGGFSLPGSIPEEDTGLESGRNFGNENRTVVPSGPAPKRGFRAVRPGENPAWFELNSDGHIAVNWQSENRRNAPLGGRWNSSQPNINEPTRPTVHPSSASHSIATNHFIDRASQRSLNGLPVRRPKN